MQTRAKTGKAHLPSADSEGAPRTTLLKDGVDGATISASSRPSPHPTEAEAPGATNTTNSVSSRSDYSSQTVKARKLAAEAQHARRLAELELTAQRRRAEQELELRQIELERSTAELELRAELAAIKANSRSSTRNASIQSWVQSIPVPEKCVCDPLSKHRNGDVSQLSVTLEKLLNKPRGSNIHLPIFDGKSPTEWLAFKQAFLDTVGLYTAAENLARLNQSLSGAAREAVYILLVAANDPHVVINALETRFGCPEKIVFQEIIAVRALPKVSLEGKDLPIFACRIKNCVELMRLLGQTDYINSPELFNTLLSKLSPLLRHQWVRYAADHLHQNNSKLELFSEFLTREVELQTKFGMNPDFLAMLYHQNTTFDTNRRGREKLKINVVGEIPVNKIIIKCIYCNNSHDIIHCSDFLTLSIDDRWKWIKKNKVCHRCLRKNPHRFKFCKINTPCGEGGCVFRHHKILHNYNRVCNIVHIDDEPKPSTSHSLPNIEISEVVEQHEKRCVETSAHAAAVAPVSELSNSRPLLKVVAVTVSGPSGSVDTYALLDDGSTATFIDSSISTQIGAKGSVGHVRIDCVGGLSRDCSVQYVDFSIKGRHCTDSYKICKARSINGLGIARQSIYNENICKYTHLIDLADVLCYSNAQPMIIIGSDNWHLTVSRSTRCGTPSQPAAINTALGWVLFGCVSSKTTKIDFVNNITSSDTISEDNESLENLIKEYYKLDSIGIEKKDYRGASDAHALKILEETTRRLSSGRFETGLIWRPDVKDVPNNYNLALSRLFNLEKKMKGDSKYAELYIQNIHAMLDKNYAEQCDSDKPPIGIKFYLPHFGVTNVNKPGKLRIVHDAAAKYQGISLNSLLLPGPDLLQPLLDILMRFRENSVALTADIKEMFPQVKIREQDRDAQRFLWRDDPTQPIKEYRMSSMIFGACSSPCTALYVKNLNALEFQTEFPDASRAIIFDTYMDDYIGSVHTAEEAARLAADIVTVHKRAGFEMRGWISNDPAALSLVPKELVSDVALTNGSVDIGRLSSPIRTLGLIWYPSSDFISFSTGVDEELPNRLTKRDVLSRLMRIYDPLGILAPIVVRGRIIFQNLWRKGLSWSDELPPTDQKVWREWFGDLISISKLKIPRYYGLRGIDISKLELHVFCDASELAYTAVAYWRFTYINGDVKLSLICSKSRVAPLKPTSIPRLELQGALIAARLASHICEAHKRNPCRRVFWCDSINVLRWLRSDARSYKPFVAHRIGEILERTDVTEWRWVPTSLNVADDATRMTRTHLSPESRWILGPEFLFTTKWPSQPIDISQSDLTSNELKPSSRSDCLVHVISLESLPKPLTANILHFSSWLKLIRATARAHKFIDLIRSKDCAKNLTAEDLRSAEVHVLRQSQLDAFSSELISLKNNRPLPQRSRLFNLSPAIDEDNLIRLSGRVAHVSDVDDAMKRPIILDSKHPAVRLLIAHFHKKAAHANTETVVNEMRQQFWVISLRSAVRSVAHNCPFCRVLRAQPIQPPMGDLPEVRLAHHRRPFSFVGLDYFGPIQVAVGRRREKRYVALYTCLVSRAVHLEVVNSLSADAAMMSLRRFIARRGAPSEIWSDNGTAFVGVNRILKGLYGSAVSDLAANEKITWKFIPPAAPFMGGAWERLVRSIKTALKATMRERTPTDEVLLTLLSEAEALVNSRPLTHVSADPDYEEALTPFHFLIGSSSGRVIPVGPQESDVSSRSAWRRAVGLTDYFWRRWVTEYLPSLIPRRGNGSLCNLKEGDMVLIGDGNLPRGVWPRGRVAKLFPGRDGVVRVVDVHTSAGLLRRPVRKLVPL